MKPLTLPGLAWRNLKMQRGQTVVMILLVLILVATMFISMLLTKSMRIGLERTTDRIGADIILVPKTHESELRNSLFMGEPCTVSCDRSVLPLVEEMPEVAQFSPQLYIATLDASCCAMPVQIIAFDPTTDFVIQSWLQAENRPELKTGEILVGASIVADVGESLRFYDQDFLVAGKLERTDTSYDDCVFMSFETSRALFKSPELLQRIDYTSPDEALSSIVIRVKDGVTPSEVAKEFNLWNRSLPMKAYTTTDMFAGISKNLRSLATYSDLLMGLLLAMSALSLICIFTLSILQRRGEFGILITVGATKRQLIGIVLTEALMIGLAGGLLGVLLPGWIAYLFRFTIAEHFGIPNLLFSPAGLMPIIGISLGVALILGLAAASFALWRLLKIEPYELIREKV